MGTKKLEIPYFPNGVASYATGDSKRDFVACKLITKLQTNPEGDAKQYDIDTLKKAIEVGKQIEKAIHAFCNENDKLRQDKFRSLISVLNSQLHLRKSLLTGSIDPKDLVRMKKDDFLGEEARLAKEKAAEDRMNAQRTDWAREKDKKSGLKDSFFTCHKCKSKKTSYYQMQTRGADEPMTNFIECLACGYQWKE